MKDFTENIYVDIDGVILTRGGQPALHLDAFLGRVLKKYKVFWLTTRCHGNNNYTVKYLSNFLSPKTIPLIKKIRPTSFQIDKTEAIDFDKNFYWLDNELFNSEKSILRKKNKYDSWIEVDLLKNPNQLAHLLTDKSH